MTYGGLEKLKYDFFRSAFDGSGADNFTMLEVVLMVVLLMRGIGAVNYQRSHTIISLS